jgi:hypothetical protein
MSLGVEAPPNSTGFSDTTPGPSTKSTLNSLYNSLQASSLTSSHLHVKRMLSLLHPLITKLDCAINRGLTTWGHISCIHFDLERLPLRA